MEEDVPINHIQIVITVKHPEQRSEIAGVNKFFVYTLEGKDNSGNAPFTQDKYKAPGGIQISTCYEKYCSKDGPAATSPLSQKKRPSAQVSICSWRVAVEACKLSFKP